MDLTQAALALWGLAVALLDARHRRIPNALTLGPALLALGCLTAFGSGPLMTPPASNLAAAALFLLFLLPGYLLDRVGGGDLKLGLALGLVGGFKIGLLTLGIGAPLLIILALREARRRAPQAPVRSVPWGGAHGVAFALAVGLSRHLPGGVF